MRLRPCTTTLIGLITLAACGGSDTPGTGERAQLDALEQRFDALEQRLAAIDKDMPTGERLRSDLQALSQRLAAVEAKADQALATAKSAPPPAASTAPAARGKRSAAAAPEAPRPDPAQRRQQLGTLMTEYRRRLDEVKREPGGDPAEQMAARRAVRDWYIARRRAIIAGTPLPD